MILTILFKNLSVSQFIKFIKSTLKNDTFKFLKKYIN